MTDIDARLSMIEIKIDYVLNLLYKLQQSCSKMDMHIDFVESIGGVLKKGHTF